MANPIYLTNQFHYSHAQPETLYAKVSFGAAGAPTLVSGTGMGIVSIVRSSAGRYVVTLSHAYQGLLALGNVFDTTATSAAPASPSVYVAADSIKISAAPTLTVQFNAAGTATDPASGEVSHLSITLQKSSVRY